MSDLQTSMGDDILQMTVCLRVRDGKEAVGQLKAIYPDEAKNAELDITAKFKLEVLKLRGPSPICPESGTVTLPRPRNLPIGGSAPWLDLHVKFREYGNVNGQNFSL